MQSLNTTELQVQNALEVLGEHFDNIVFLGSVVRDGETQRLFQGIGNKYALEGMCREFLIEAEENSVENFYNYNDDFDDGMSASDNG